MDYKNLSNGDHIRQMNDEELARWLVNFFWGREKQVRLFDIFKWLKEPFNDEDKS